MPRWQRSLWTLSLLGALACGGVRSDAPRVARNSTLAPTLAARGNAISAAHVAREEARVVLAPEPPRASQVAARPEPPPEPVIDPVERDYPLHGTAFHMVAQVFAEPSDKPVVTGYLRRGAKLRAKPGKKGPGCSSQWHEVLGGGFVCSSNGFLIGKTPQTFSPAPNPPMLYAELPYAYGKAVAEVPQYFRAPSSAEERGVFELLRDAKARGVVPVPKLGWNSDAGSELLAKTTSESGATPITTEPLPDFVRLLMRPGFYVSVDGREQVEERTLARTVRGGYVRADALIDVGASGLRGVALGGDLTLPIALAYRNGAPSFTRDPLTGALLAGEPLSALEAFKLTDEIAFREKRRARVTQDGRLVFEDVLRIATPTPRPALVSSRSRWIAITLSNQTLVAYEGDKPVFATLVSTGKPGHETKTGIFRIQEKHISTTMDGAALTDEAYSIEDVPFTMYFSGSLALHGAFWHGAFGRVRSHGCVNLAPADARWLFDWSAPMLPSGFHGVLATRENPGTFVVIEP